MSKKLKDFKADIFINDIAEKLYKKVKSYRLKKLAIFILFILMSTITYAQAHDYRCGCRLSTGPVTCDNACAGCVKEKADAKKAAEEETKQQQAKAAEALIKREADAKKAAEDMAKKLEDEKKEKIEITIGSTPNNSQKPNGEKNDIGTKKSATTTENNKTPAKQTTSTSMEEQRAAAALEFQRRQKESQAKVLETEGDRLNALGSIFMDAALKKYQEAQQYYYSYTVQSKIDKIQSTKEAVKLINDGMEKLGDFADDMQTSMDEAGLPRWRVTTFSYDGLTPGFDGYQTQKKITPQTFSITHGFYRIFAMEVGFNYYKSPVYKLGLQDNNKRYTGNDIEGSYTAVGPEVSIGLALGGKNVAVYALYGYYFPFVIGATPYSTEYEYTGSFKHNFGITTTISKLKFGTFISVPKSRFGIGLRYTMNGVNGEKLISGGPTGVIDKYNNKYSIGPGKYNSIDKLKYNSVCVSLVIKAL